jgi:hypothetical protein
VKTALNFPLALLLVTAAPLSPRATSAQASSDLMPTTMAQCEPDSCATWSFQGKQGIGRWTTGPVANLTIEHFDASAVTIRREDATGVGQGIKGLYTGTRKSDHIEGTFTWVWPGHAQLSAGTVDWHATIQHLPQGYNAAWRVKSATWTIPPGSKRFNLNGTWQHNAMVKNGVKYVFQMQIDQSGDDVSIVFHDKLSPLDGLTFYLGRELNDLLITGQHLDTDKYLLEKTQWAPENIAVIDPDHLITQTGAVFFRVSNPGPDDARCDLENSSRTEPVYAFFRGQAAFKAQDYPKAVCWMRIGAGEGDAQSQGVLAILLHEGVGTGKDFPQAFSWAQKSAAQNNIVGETILAELYQKGDGTAPDAKKAEFWRGAATVDERRQNEHQWSIMLNTPDASGLTGMDGIMLELSMEGTVNDAEQKYRNSQACIDDHPGYVTLLSGLTTSAASMHCH